MGSEGWLGRGLGNGKSRDREGLGKGNWYVRGMGKLFMCTFLHIHDEESNYCITYLLYDYQISIILQILFILCFSFPATKHFYSSNSLYLMKEEKEFCEKRRNCKERDSAGSYLSKKNEENETRKEKKIEKIKA